MKTKLQIKKSVKQKKYAKPALVAEVVGCQKDTVRKVLRGLRSGETELGENILIADMLLNDGMNKLVEEVKRVVTFE